MSELEKMLAGEQYHSLDPDLMSLRDRAKRFTHTYNNTQDVAEKQAMLSGFLGRVGMDCLIECPFFCNYGDHISMGDHVFLNYNCVLLDNAKIQFGNHIMVGPNVQFYTAVHPLDAETRNQLLETAEPIIIEDNVWIGGSAVILPGVTVGHNAVVGAGAVVTASVHPYTVVAGNPARCIRQLKPETHG